MIDVRRVEIYPLLKLHLSQVAPDLRHVGDVDIYVADLGAVSGGACAQRIAAPQRRCAGSLDTPEILHF